MSPFPAPHPHTPFLCVFPLAAPFNSAVPMWETRDPAFFCTADPTGRWDEGTEGEKEPTRPAPKNFFFLGAPLLSLFRSNEGDFFCAHFSSFCWRAVGSFAQGFQLPNGVFGNSVGYSLSLGRSGTRADTVHFLTLPSLTSKVTSEAAASTHSRSLSSPEKTKKTVCFCFPFYGGGRFRCCSLAQGR